LNQCKTVYSTNFSTEKLKAESVLKESCVKLFLLFMNSDVVSKSLNSPTLGADREVKKSRNSTNKDGTGGGLS
jgi:hypothetical protein